jgi:hypothetical protein
MNATPQRTVTEWSQRIWVVSTRTAETVIALGRELLEAKADLGHGNFGAYSPNIRTQSLARSHSARAPQNGSCTSPRCLRHIRHMFRFCPRLCGRSCAWSGSLPTGVTAPSPTDWSTQP